MNKPVLRRVAGLGAAITVATGLLAVGAPAHASERPIDITGYKVADFTVGDSNCRNVKVSASTKAKGDYLDAYASVDVTRGGGVIDALWLEGRKPTDRAFICPSFSGLGTYKVGPADVFAEFEYYDSYVGEYSSDYRSYTDNTSKKFQIRGKTKSTLSAKRQGAKVTLTAKAQVYSPEKYRYAQYNSVGAKFQVKSGTKWKTIKTVNLKKGTASITVKQSKKKSYRLQVPTASWAASNTSKSVSR